METGKVTRLKANKARQELRDPTYLMSQPLKDYLEIEMDYTVFFKTNKPEAVDSRG